MRSAAGDLRESVVLSCASWCQLQRAPLGKLLKLQADMARALSRGRAFFSRFSRSKC